MILKKIELDVKDKDYLDFLSISIEEELSVEDKLKNIIKYHIITYRNRRRHYDRAEPFFRLPLENDDFQA